VAPTLLALAGADSGSSELRGRDLMLLMNAGEDDSTPGGPAVVAVRNNQKKFYAPWKAGRGDVNIAVRNGSLKAVVNVEIATVEVFDLEVDPGEMNDLIGERREDAERLAAFAADWLADCGARDATVSQLDEETLDQLRSLGYVD